jgi:aspartate racemase
MRTLGLIGGTTWHSTLEYYRGINAQVAARRGELSSAELLLYSVDFAAFQPATDPAGWERIARGFADIARRLEHAGAKCIVLCANTAHIVADSVQASVAVPLLHIADATAEAVAAAGLSRVGLLGTRPTMEHTFFSSRLAKRGIATLVPDEAERAYIHASILGELGRGVFTPETRARYLAIGDRLAGRGAQGIILGCTEIPMLLTGTACPWPTIDTMEHHVRAAVAFALGEST